VKFAFKNIQVRIQSLEEMNIISRMMSTIHKGRCIKSLYTWENTNNIIYCNYETGVTILTEK